MKITIFGLTLSSSWGNGHATPYRAILRALDRRGARVVFYEKDVPYYAEHRDFLTCDLLRSAHSMTIGTKSGARRCRKPADSDIVVTASYTPEGARISDDILALPAPLHVFYDLDTPVTLGRLNRGRWTTCGANRSRNSISTCRSPEAICCAVLSNSTALASPARLYGCVDPDVYRRVEAREDFACALSYLGTYAV